MKKYKIGVLTDLRDNLKSSLKSTISLAKMIDAEIDVYYVKKATDIVSKESQLSAIRSINEDFMVTERKMKQLIAPIAEEYDININYHFSFGNVKSELQDFIVRSQPDIIILGKRKSKRISLIGDNITQFVLDFYKGAIMITDNQNVLEPYKEISLGLFNNIGTSLNFAFAKDLLGNSQQPLKSFKVLKTNNSSYDFKSENDTKEIEFVFEKSDNTIENLGSYLTKNNINLLCIDRDNDYTEMESGTVYLSELIKKLNVSLLLTGETKN